MVTPRKRIETFEELLRRVKQPKVPELGEGVFAVPDDAQARGINLPATAGLGLPPGWKLNRVDGVDSLTSPRGLTFKDIKLQDGKITNLKPFKGDRPVSLQKLPPISPEPLALKETPTLPELPPPPTLLPEDLGKALRTTGIPLEQYEALPEDVRATLVRPGEFLGGIELPGGVRGVEIGGEPVPFAERVGETVIAAARTPLFSIAGVGISASDIAAVALIAFGITQVGQAGWNMLLDRVLKRPGDLNILGERLTRAGINRNLAILERQRGIKIPPAAKQAFIDKYLKDMAASWARNVAGQGARINPQALQIASQNTYKATADAVNAEITALIPRATQTGALAAGTLPAGQEPTIASVTQKIASQQPLDIKERQLYANESQAVEAELQAQVPTEVPAEVPTRNIDEILSEKHPQINAFVFERPDSIRLQSIRVPKELQREGLGTAYINDLVAYADEVGKAITLSTGGRGFDFPKTKLIEYYKRFGFVENKGRNLDLRISDTMYRLPKEAPPTVAKPPVEAVTSEVAPVTPAVIEPTVAPTEVAPEVIPPTEVVTTPQQATREVERIQQQGQTAPETVPPQDAERAHVELAAPDGPQPPKPPVPPEAKPAGREPDDILREISEKGFNERADQTLLRLHEAAISNETRRTGITIKEGGQKLNKLNIGTWRRDHLIPRPKDIPKLDELYIALHNPSGVATGEVKVPKGFEDVYEELRALADWDTVSRIDFDPNAATIDDWFFRGWKPPQDMFTTGQARLGVKPRVLKTPRVDATYQEMRDLGFEPLFWNPYEQWGYRHNIGMKYEGQMNLIKYLKGMGEELIRPHDGGPIPVGWRVPEIGPAFEGKPFAMKDPDTGIPGVMYTRRWITDGKVANTLESIYGKRPNLGRFVVKGREIDPLSIIDAITFIPKRAKLFGSFFQQVDFLTRAGAGSWSQAVDALIAGKPIESVKALAKFPITFEKVLQANFSPTTRLKLSKQLDSTEPLVQGRPGITLKGISDAGLSTIDPTIFPADMDKLVRDVATETGILGKGKRFVSMVGDIESAMRRGLFQGVYPAAITTDIKNNIAQMVARQHPSLNDAQINSIIARIANIKYSTIPASQSVIQNRILRETLRRLFFSVGESEGLLRQATNAFHGPNKRFWWKHFIGVYLFVIATASIIHFASTGKPLPADRYSPISQDNWGPLPFGYNTKFAAPDIPIKGRGGVNLTLDLVGQMDTAFRVLDPVNFITSRESVFVRAAQNQISGTDFYGAPIDDLGPGGIVSRTSQLLFDLFAPIGAGPLTQEVIREALPTAREVIPRAEDRLGLSGLAIQATGLNLRAETTLNLLDRHARESGFLKADGTPVESWSDLEPYQKKELSKNEELQTELDLRSIAAIERQQLKAQGFATLDDLDQERVARGEALVSEFFARLEREGVDASDEAFNFRSEATALKREISVRKAQVDEDFQLFKETGKVEKDPNKRALNEYYSTYDRATNKSGTIDWDKQEAFERAFRRGWTGAQEAYVDRNIGLTEWGPLFNEYEIARRTLSDSGYWDTPAEDRKKFRRDNPEIEAILIGKFYGYVPLIEQGRTTKITGRASITPTSVFGGAGGGVSRPRQAAPTFPKFKTPKISTGLSISAPRAP